MKDIATFTPRRLTGAIGIVGAMGLLALLGVFLLRAGSTEGEDRDAPLPVAPQVATGRPPPDDPAVRDALPAPNASQAPVRPAMAVTEEGLPVDGGRTGSPDAPVVDAGFIISFESEGGISGVAFPNRQGEFFPPAGLPDVPYRLSAHDVRAPLRSLEVEASARPSEMGGRTFVFTRPLSESEVTVMCSETDGKPVSAQVRIIRVLGDKPEFTVARLTTGEVDGRAVVRISARGRYEAIVDTLSTRAVAPMRGPSQIFEVVPGSPAAVSFVFERSARMDVEVVGRDGKPIPKALVGLKFWDGGLVRASPKSGWTEERGTFAFEGLEPGPVVVHVTAPEVLPGIERVWLLPGESRTVQIRMEGGAGRLKGVLKGLPEGSARGMNIWLNRAATRPEEVFSIWGATLDSVGGFVITGVMAGHYELNISSSKFKRKVLMVNASAEETVLEPLDLAPLVEIGVGSAFVRVRTTGTGYMSFWGLYRRQDWPPGLWASAEFKTQRKEITGLTPGRYTFRFSPTVNDSSRFNLSDSREVVVAEDGIPVEVELFAPRNE